MFYADDYNDNIEYCRYVFEKNQELDLGLSSSREIQFVANNYLDEVYARRGIIDDEVFKDDKLLVEVINKLEKKFRKFKQVSKTYDETLEVEDYKNNTKFDEKLNKKGGYLYNDNYDDVSLDDVPKR